jgi:hypothetical protein
MPRLTLLRVGPRSRPLWGGEGRPLGRPWSVGLAEADASFGAASWGGWRWRHRVWFVYGPRALDPLGGGQAVARAREEQFSRLARAVGLVVRRSGPPWAGQAVARAREEQFPRLAQAGVFSCAEACSEAVFRSFRDRGRSDGD